MRATKGRPYDSSSIVGERRNFCFAEIRRPDFGTLPFVRLQKTCVISPYISRHYDTWLVRYTIEVNQMSERCSPLHYVDTKKDSTLKMLSFFYIHMGLSFHFPELYRVWLKLAAAAKIMDSACEKLLCLTAACVKVSCERLIVSVYCNKDTLTRCV